MNVVRLRLLEQFLSNTERAAIHWFGLLGVMLGMLISTLSSRLSVFGLSDVRGVVHAGFDEGSWIVTSHAVGQMFVAPLAIWLGSVYGPRRVLSAAALAFAAISFIKPLSTDINALLALQFLGGMASGFFVPLTLSYVLKDLPRRVWPFGIAVYALNLEFSTNISASLEGWYVDHLTWQWIFWQNVPLSLAMAACMYSSNRGAPDPIQMRGCNLFGLVSSGIGLSLIYAALDQGNRLDWLSSGLIVALLLSGLVLLVGFVFNEIGNRTPLIDFNVALNAPLPQTALLIAFVRLTVLATALVIPQFLATVRGFRAIETGQTLNWIALPQLVVCMFASLLLRVVDPRVMAACGFGLMSVSCLTVAHGLTPVWGWTDFLPSQLMQAVGQCFALTGVLYYAALNLQPKDALTFGAVTQIARLMGGEFGQAFVSTFVRVRAQIASNLIGLHVQAGSPAVEARLQVLAGALHAHAAANSAAPATRTLDTVVRTMAFTQAVVDTFVTIGVLAAFALVVVATCRPPPSAAVVPQPEVSAGDAKP
jgi:MFS transporter, DHA2 family, multidrug resistance protein